MLNLHIKEKERQFREASALSKDQQNDGLANLRDWT